MRYLTVMNVAGEIYKVYRTANSSRRAEYLARITVARKKGLISPRALNPSDIRTQEVPGR